MPLFVKKGKKAEQAEEKACEEVVITGEPRVRTEEIGVLFADARDTGKSGGFMIARKGFSKKRRRIGRK